jgi:hypothetical protein
MKINIVDRTLELADDPDVKERASHVRSMTGELEDRLEGADLERARALILAFQQACDEDGID